jgi:drug/metabolite transporter (DMT)-like permease
MTSSTDYLKLHFIVFLWGFSAILGKLVSRPAAEMVWYRSILAAIGMGAVILVTRGTFMVSRRDLVKLLGIGGVVALHWIAFFGSARVSNVSVSLVGFATNSLWTALLEPWVNKTSIKKYELLLGLLVIAGLYLIFSFDFQYKAGLLLAIFAGFTSAVFAVANSRFVKRIPARSITFYEMLGVVAATGMFVPLYHVIAEDRVQLPVLPTGMDILYIAILAGVCSVYAYTVAVELMKRISVFMIQLTLNLEPVYGIIMAVIIFGQQEKMNLHFYAGTLLILSAVISYPLVRRRFGTTVLID